MSNFALLPMDLGTTIPFYKLVRDKKCLVDEFWKDVSKDGNLKGKLDDIIAILQDVGNLKLLPKTKYRIIQGQKQRYKVSEVKVKPLRLYLIKVNGFIIVFGGKKNAQDKDIDRAKSIAKQYEDYLTKKLK